LPGMKTMLIVESTKGRENLLSGVEKTLAANEAIVRITDTISIDSSTLTVPTDPTAEVIAREPPKLLPGGVTALISYVRIHGPSPFKATEYRLEKTQIVASREVALKPERVGKTSTAAAGGA